MAFYDTLVASIQSKLGQIKGSRSLMVLLFGKGPTGEPVATALTRDGAAHINGSVRYWLKYTPSADDIALGPCDAVLVSTDGATLTAKAADSADAAAAGPPLAAKVWHPMSCLKVTDCSAGDVWIGWYRKPAA